MHPDIQSFPNTQYYDGALLCGLKNPPPAIDGIPWSPSKGTRAGTKDTGELADDEDPCHRVLYIHCSGQETHNGDSPSNRMQADAVEYIFDKVHDAYGRTPTVLVLTPYRGQHTFLSHKLAKYKSERVQVSTIDAAQGQEADLVIITFVRANATGSVGFTDDAKRLNVAITRAMSGVITVGHLATSLAASTSGFGSLLHDLRKQGAIYEYARSRTDPPMCAMTEEDFNKYEREFPADTKEAQRRRKREGKDRALQADTRDIARAPESDITHAVESTRGHLAALTKSTSFMLAMSHACSLEQKIVYNNDTAPNSVADWDRQTWSAQNYFSTPNVSVDVGNFILATMLFAIRHALGMESPIDQHQHDEFDIKGSHRPAPWKSEQCTWHPIVSGSATAGMARKQGYLQAIANMAGRNVPPAKCLRVVIETLIQDEVGHRVSLGTKIGDATCELLGDVLEAARGTLLPIHTGGQAIHEVHA